MNEPTRATALGAAPPVEAAPGRGRSRDRTRARDRDRSRSLSPARGEAPARHRARGEFPGGGTRERIQSIALELFAEQGYEKTSLREIAERLGVTKAALYYHFRSKEDIVRSFMEDYRAELEQVIAWGAGQPPTPETPGRDPPPLRRHRRRAARGDPLHGTEPGRHAHADVGQRRPQEDVP